MAMIADSQTLPSPWAQVVRGASDDATPQSPPPSASPEPPETEEGNANKPKKVAWSKPVGNGVTETAVSPLMMKWPVLSESSKPSPKSSPPLVSIKIGSDDSVVSVSQGLPVILHSPQKQSSSSNAMSNHNAPTRQRSLKRGVLAFFETL